jgi:hypothetical protein
VTELTSGALIRGLHHGAASMMIMVVVPHMTQVFLYGAYKKPREACATQILSLFDKRLNPKHRSASLDPCYAKPFYMLG